MSTQAQKQAQRRNFVIFALKGHRKMLNLPVPFALQLQQERVKDELDKLINLVKETKTEAWKGL